jgi:serine/threonine-protein kinase
VTDPLVGLVINGKFRVVEAIGQGGMGAVYRAEQQPLGRIVAVKVLRNKPGVLQVDPAFQRRFFLEASLCAKLSHPNIVTVYDYGRIETVPEEAYFMAMELLEGETLHSRLRKSGGALPIGDVLSITLEIARGLREAHRNGIVHRDLKPGNVMLVPDAEAGEKVKILDFGLVKQVEGDNREDLTQEGSFLGSPKYMSPEQIDKADVDHRTDLYSLGVIMYQALCGKVPFDGPSSMQILLAHVASPIPSMKDRNPLSDVPPLLENLVRKLLAKNPADRFANADELIRELRAIQPQLGVATRGKFAQATGDHPMADGMPVEPSGSLVAASLSERRPSMVAPLSPTRSKAVAAALVFIGIAALGSAGAMMMKKSAAPVRAAAPTAANVAPPPPRSEPSTDPTPATVRIESNPPGAVITENGQNLGVTPLALSVDPARTETRHFLLSLNGYQQYTLDQPPTRENARVVAILVPAAPPSADTSAAASAHAANGNTHANSRSRARGNRAASGSANGANGTPVGHGLEIMTER